MIAVVTHCWYGLTIASDRHGQGVGYLGEVGDHRFVAVHGDGGVG